MESDPNAQQDSKWCHYVYLYHGIVDDHLERNSDDGEVPRLEPPEAGMRVMEGGVRSDEDGEDKQCPQDNSGNAVVVEQPKIVVVDVSGAADVAGGKPREPGG